MKSLHLFSAIFILIVLLSQWNQRASFSLCLLRLPDANRMHLFHPFLLLPLGVLVFPSMLKQRPGLRKVQPL